MIKEVVTSRNQYFIYLHFNEAGTLKLIFFSLTEWKLSLNSTFYFLKLF